MKNIPAPVLAVSTLLAAGLFLSGCAPCGSRAPGSSCSLGAAALPRPAPDEFTVMTFNLHDYRLVDGADGSLAPRPRPEARVLVDAIRTAAPDILVVQEMGGPDAWQEFKDSLRQAGLDHAHELYLPTGTAGLNMAVLSRFPIAASQAHTNDLYTIGPTQFPVQRGILEADIAVNPSYRLRLMAAHLKSKAFHEYGQAEMRRNEARLLCNHVRAALKENPDVNLLVVGDLNDDPASAPLQEITRYQDKTLLHDLRPEDDAGAAWTQRSADDTHQRADYLLVSDGLLPETVLAKTCVVNFPALARASDHRPLLGTFRAAEQPPAAKPDLSARRPAEFSVDD